MYHVRLANSNNKWIYDFRFDSYLNNTIEKNHKRKVKFGFSRRHETTGRDCLRIVLRCSKIGRQMPVTRKWVFKRVERVTGRRQGDISSPSKTKIITHPLHDSRMRLQTNSVIEIEDSSARRTCSEFVRPRAVPPATPHKHHICRNIFGRTPVALAGIYTRGTLSGFTYVWYYSGGKCGSLVGHASVLRFQTVWPRVARETSTRKSRTSARIISLTNGDRLYCNKRRERDWILRGFQYRFSFSSFLILNLSLNSSFFGE